MNNSVQANNTRTRGMGSLIPHPSRDEFGMKPTNRSFYQTAHAGRGKSDMTFKEVWKKAIEKYSPKKAEKLNEVSFRFQQKLDEIA